MDKPDKLYLDGNMVKKLLFYVNGCKVEVDCPSPETTLAQYLRRTLILPGTKVACGQGGCGACTVMVSRYDWINKKILHFSVNACITPICYLHGMAVTTVEGVGGTRNGLHPIQKSLVESHGLQCGFCTPGMVMSMYTLFHNVAQPTTEQMERALEGNLCRCTGYRPIVEAFKKASKECPCGLGLCNQTDTNEDTAQTTKKLEKLTKDNTQHLIFPPDLQINESYYRSSLMLTGDNYVWFRPNCLEELLDLKCQHPNASLLMGCTFVRDALKCGELASTVIICGTHVPELLSLEVADNKLKIGSAVTMAALENYLETMSKTASEAVCRTIKSLLHALRWIGVDQVRNVATIGGHIMSDAPNHDLQTLMTALGVQLTFQCKGEFNNPPSTKTIVMDHAFFINGPGRPGSKEILTCLTIPMTGQEEYILFQKQPSRRGFDYAIVNAALYIKFNSNKVQDCRFCVGNIDKKPYLAKRTSAVFNGKSFDDNTFQQAVDVLIQELGGIGGHADIKFRTTLAGSFMYKMFLEIQQQKKISGLPADLQCALKFYNMEPSTGIQVYDVPDDAGNHAVYQPIPNVTSEYIVSGEALYIDDMPSMTNELFAALVTSTKSHAKILNIDPSEALKVDGVVDFICRKDVPGKNNYGTIIHDDQLFADGEVHHYGQTIGAVLAKTREIAHKAKKLVKVEYEELDSVYTIDDAIAKNSLFGYQFSLEDEGIDKVLSEADQIVEGVVESPSQEHLYMETQSALAIPKHEQMEMDIFSSTQGVNEIQGEVAQFLAIPRNRVNAKCKRAGGGFGGKGNLSIMPAGIAAVGAWKTRRPVRCIFDRTTDMRTTGKRHPMKAFYKVGVTKEGQILGIDYKLYLNAGWSNNLSIAVLNFAVLLNSAYNIPCARIKGFLCKTNTVSNTAFRGFGAPQRLFFIENVVNKISYAVGKPLNMVKEINLIKDGAKNLAGTTLDGNNQQLTWTQCKQQADYDKRLAAIEKFNKENKWRKRGIAITPAAFQFGYPFAAMNQGYAFVSIYLDGSVMVSHGGIELGQGINTKMQQIAATVLGIPMNKIIIAEATTEKTPNTSETAGSFGADLNGGAVLDACNILSERLKAIKVKKPDGVWEEWIGMAYGDRISLSAVGHYIPPGFNPGFDYAKRQGEFAWYFSHSAACSEVEIDCLTGEHQLLQVDIVMDVGKSLNPALDVGQIEGGFIQGYGYMTTEAVKVNPTSGQIKNAGPLDYKIPGLRNIPRKMNVTLLKESKGAKAVYSSKGIGEPPFLLAVSVHTALQEAVIAARKEAGLEGYYQLQCPATVDRIRLGCGDKLLQKCEAIKVDPSTRADIIL